MTSYGIKIGYSITHSNVILRKFIQEKLCLKVHWMDIVQVGYKYTKTTSKELLTVDTPPIIKSERFTCTSNRLLEFYEPWKNICAYLTSDSGFASENFVYNTAHWEVNFCLDLRLWTWQYLVNFQKNKTNWWQPRYKDNKTLLTVFKISNTGGYYIRKLQKICKKRK
jgi:hypothetical protein